METLFIIMFTAFIFLIIDHLYIRKNFIDSQINSNLMQKEIEIEKKSSALSYKINKKKLKNIQAEIFNILILVRALYFRKISNLILDKIFKKYAKKFTKLGSFKDDRGNTFSFIICKEDIENLGEKGITSLVDFLMFIREYSSEIIHLHYIFGGIEIPKDKYLVNQQYEDSKEDEGENSQVRVFPNDFKVNINVVVDYLFDGNNKDIISKYIELIDPKNIVPSKNIEYEIDKAISDIIQKQEKNKEVKKEIIFEEEEEKNLQDIDLFNNSFDEEDEEKGDNKNYKNYLEEIQSILNSNSNKEILSKRETIIDNLKTSIKRNNRLLMADKKILCARRQDKNFISPNHFFSKWKNEFSKSKAYRNDAKIKAEIDLNITAENMKDILLILLKDGEFNLFIKDVGDFSKYIY